MEPEIIFNSMPQWAHYDQYFTKELRKGIFHFPSRNSKTLTHTITFLQEHETIFNSTHQRTRYNNYRIKKKRTDMMTPDNYPRLN